jgi:hypothetical protein
MSAYCPFSFFWLVICCFGSRMWGWLDSKHPKLSSGEVPYFKVVVEIFIPVLVSLLCNFRPTSRCQDAGPHPPRQTTKKILWSTNIDHPVWNSIYYKSPNSQPFGPRLRLRRPDIRFDSQCSASNIIAPLFLNAPQCTISRALRSCSLCKWDMRVVGWSTFWGTVLGQKFWTVVFFPTNPHQKA